MEPMIPLSVLVSRFEKHQEQFREHYQNLKWYQWKKKAMIAGMVCIYDHEISMALDLASKTIPKTAKH